VRFGHRVPYMRKSRLKAGETAAVFGVADWAYRPYSLQRLSARWTSMAVDINENKLSSPRQYGAIPVNAKQSDAVTEIRRLTGGKGADVTLELIGCRRRCGRRCNAGCDGTGRHCRYRAKPLEIDTYRELLGKPRSKSSVRTIIYTASCPWWSNWRGAKCSTLHAS